MVLRRTFKGVIAISACVITACGMEPSGGSSKYSDAATKKSTQQTSGVPSNNNGTQGTSTEGTQNSSDAVKAGIAELPSEYAALKTDEADACHTEGNVYERRNLRCSQSMKLASSYTCDKAGIKVAFKVTGFQIDEALNAAEKDKFVFDQCGESESGQLIAYFVRLDDDGSFTVREIETKLK